jgi:quinol monooxygenase YgiN
MIAIIGTLHIDPERRPEVVAEFRRMVADAVAEDGCVGYVVSADLDDENTFYIHEQWRDEDALAAHTSSPAFLAHRERAVGHLLGGVVRHHRASGVEEQTFGSLA